MDAPQSSSSALRWVMRIMLGVCGLAIVAVLLSQPRMERHILAGLKQVETVLSSFRSDKKQPEQIVELTPVAEITDVSVLEPAPAANSALSYKPAVTTMPTSRTPVHRLGQSRED